MDHVRKALIVDDCPDVARMLTSFLCGNGYSVSRTDQPDAALTLIASGRTDVVLVDKQLGAASGIDLVRDLRSRGYAGAIILMSGYFEPEEINRGLDVGADLVISKPIRDLAWVGKFIDCCADRSAKCGSDRLLCLSADIQGHFVESFDSPWDHSAGVLASACSRRLQSPHNSCTSACCAGISCDGASRLDATFEASHQAERRE